MKNRGFTLGEMVTTVAIIGILSAVAVPNFMRIRMEVNMEMVKQALRVAGEKLTEIMGVQKRFPSNAEIGAGATGEDEISLTATLSSIDGKGYTRDYTVDETFSFAMIRSDPIRSPGGGISGAGDKCFLWDPIENVRDIPCWSAQGMNLVSRGAMPGQFPPFGVMRMENVLQMLLSDPSVSDQRKAELIANTFAVAAYQLDWMKTNPLPGSPVPADAILAYQVYSNATLAALLPQINQILESRGIQMFAGNSSIPSAQLVGFEVANPVISQADLNRRIQSASAGGTAQSYWRSIQDE